MLKLLVTGESGLLGNRIVKLAGRSFAVVPCHNTNSLNPGSLKLDITDAKEVSEAFERIRPDLVVHAASQTNVDKCETDRKEAWKINVEGTHNIAVACCEENAKLVYVSTDYVFDGEKGNYVEEDETDPINYYGLTKLEGEKQVARNRENHVILRASVIYGWHPWKLNFATWVLAQLRQGKEITVVDDHYNTPTLADNLAEIVIEVLERDLRGTYHASGSERINRFELAKRIAETFNLNPGLVRPIKMSQLTSWIARRPRDSSLDASKLQKQLRTRVLNINEGLNRMKSEAQP
jgi:dTDP-4-dehydrorhamnose reductase